MKIIVTGASGWLGRNSIRFFLNNGLQIENLIFVGSSKREINVGDGIKININTFEETIKSLDSNEVEGIVHLAYLTRDKVGKNIGEYIEKNLIITDQIFQLLKSKPKWLSYVSSGAIYSNFEKLIIENDPKTNPYGFLKYQDEQKFSKYCMENSINLSIGRLWGASGTDFINPAKYAFGEFVLKTIANQDIEISSPRKVFRKYCDSEQFMEICIRTAQQYPFTVFNSSGELIEIEELANLVVKTLSGKNHVTRKILTNHEIADDYYSRDNDFFTIAKNLKVDVLSLQDQILKTFDFLRTCL